MDLSVNKIASLTDDIAQTAADIAKGRKQRKNNLDILTQTCEQCEHTKQEVNTIKKQMKKKAG